MRGCGQYHGTFTSRLSVFSSGIPSRRELSVPLVPHPPVLLATEWTRRGLSVRCAAPTWCMLSLEWELLWHLLRLWPISAILQFDVGHSACLCSRFVPCASRRRKRQLLTCAGTVDHMPQWGRHAAAAPRGVCRSKDSSGGRSGGVAVSLLYFLKTCSL